MPASGSRIVSSEYRNRIWTMKTTSGRPLLNGQYLL